MKGRISTALTVWCGLCDEWLHLESKTKHKAGDEAKSLGWKFTGIRGIGWICHQCNKEAETQGVPWVIKYVRDDD